ncbi:MAG TPA: class I SAM-dependent methyltransferase [Gammaproteobacteria bacterium]
MWDERYSQAEYAYGKSPNDFLKQHIARLNKGRSLCLADGEGRNSVFLAEYDHDVVAVDQSAPGMQKARELAEEKSVSIEAVVADLADFTIEENCWDNIVSIFCHLPVDLRKQVHASAVRGLRSGGILLLEAYTPQQIQLGTGGPPVAEMTMTLELLQDELKGLEFLHAEEKQREVVEGLYHTGTGAVVQVIARKP